MKFLLVCVMALLLACESVTFGPAQCAALVSIVEDLVVEITAEEITNEAKVAKVAKYTELAANLAQLGCAFVPLPESPPESP